MAATQAADASAWSVHDQLRLWLQESNEDCGHELGSYIQAMQLVQAMQLLLTLCAVCVLRWVDRVFTPTANRQGGEGWDMLKVADAIRAEASTNDDRVSAAAARAIKTRVGRAGYNYFRLHPKGRGVVCARPDGIPAFSFVEEYFGELHTGQ